MVRRRDQHPRTPGFRLDSVPEGTTPRRVEPTARREGRPYNSRSLRSAQSRKRVPSFAVAVTPGREFMNYPGLLMDFVEILIIPFIN
jgi:hypothetical protein